MTSEKREEIKPLIDQHLRPIVTEIDREGLYPTAFLKRLGQQGYFRNGNRDLQAHLALIEEVATACGSTAFLVWCQLMAIEYVRRGQSQFLKQEILEALERGELLGGTGLSNAMKYYAGIEPLKLVAEKSAKGYRINGTLPFVSNLGENHWFGIVFEVEGNRRVFGMVPCEIEGLTITELNSFLGMNGTATYSCVFDDVILPFEYVIHEEADAFVAEIRQTLVLAQVGIGLGLVKATIGALERQVGMQEGINRFLKVQPEDLESRYQEIKDEMEKLSRNSLTPKERMGAIFKIRLQSSYLALEAANAGMLHGGGVAYLFGSSASRRLREAYFYSLITPSVKHLEKVVQMWEG